MAPGVKNFEGDAPSQRTLRWHRTLAQITGALSLTYSRRKLSRVALATWAADLEATAKEMRDAAADGEEEKG